MGRSNQCADNFSCLAQDRFYTKKKTYGYIERNQAKRQTFNEQLAAVPVSQRVYVDEAGMDNRDEYSYGWNPQGQRFYALKTGRRVGRVNMIAAWCAQQLLAPFTVDGACNRAVFETWVEICLVPILQPGQVVILDNATKSKGGRIQHLIEQAGARLLYLPPYSPDLNKIEHCWSWLKSRIRKCLSLFKCLRDAIEHVLHLAS